MFNDFLEALKDEQFEETHTEDLKKAIFYIQDEINRIEGKYGRHRD